MAVIEADRGIVLETLRQLEIRVDELTALYGGVAFAAETFVVPSPGANVDAGPILQQIIDTCPDGSRILLPDLDYYLGTGILIGKDNITIEAMGYGMNPDNGGRCRLWTNNAIAMIRFDKRPGGAPLGAPTSTYVINQGGLRGVALDGGGVATIGLRVVQGINMVLEDFGVRSCLLGVELNNHGTTAGGDDSWDQNSHNVWHRGELISAGANVGIKIDHAYSIRIQAVSITTTGNGGVGADLYGCDDVWFEDCNFLATDAGAISVRLWGGNFAGAGPGPATHIKIRGGYLTGNATQDILALSNGYDYAPMLILEGIPTVDGEPNLVAQPGCQISYHDDEGRHIYRKHLPRATIEDDDFLTSNLTSGQIGKLGWNLSTSGTGSLSAIAAVQWHPGIVRLGTGSTANSLSALFLGAAGLGPIHPIDSFDIEFLCKPNSNDGDVQYRVGLVADATANPSTDGIYFEKLYGDSVWFAVCRVGGVQTRASTGISVGSAAWQRLRIRRHHSTAIGFSIGQSVNVNDNARVTTNIPNVALALTHQINNQVGATKTLDIDAVGITVRNISRY